MTLLSFLLGWYDLMIEYAFKHKNTDEFVCTSISTGTLLLALPHDRHIDRVVKFPTLNDAVVWLRDHEDSFVTNKKDHKPGDKCSILIDDLVFVSMSTATLSPNLRLLLAAGKKANGA